ncbi:transporter substrate-binding domain-containing protein [Desulfatiferula olefinivorans]
MKCGKERVAKGLVMMWACLVLGLAATAPADTITIVADEWSPYNGNPASNKPGYGIDIAKRVFETEGHTVVYTVIPWSRAILDTREGKYNAVIGALREDAPDFIFPDEAFGLYRNAFFVKKGHPFRYRGPESLLTVRVGLIKDYSYGEPLDAFFSANRHLVQYSYGEDPLEININKLLLDRFDVLVEDMNVFREKARVMGVSDQIVTAGIAGKGHFVYIAFSPRIEKSSRYAGMLSAGIRRLKASGELDSILGAYGLSYWK